MADYGPIRHFTDIQAWKLGRELKKRIYALCKKLPKEERYDLGSQMRKAAVSVTSNIAEGFGRFHFQENIQFCRQSRGSLFELQDHIITCYDMEYTDRDESKEIYSITIHATRALNGYIRWLKGEQQRCSNTMKVKDLECNDQMTSINTNDQETDWDDLPDPDPDIIDQIFT
jgi:four helix bundle protein